MRDHLVVRPVARRRPDPVEHVAAVREAAEGKGDEHRGGVRLVPLDPGVGVVVDEPLIHLRAKLSISAFHDAVLDKRVAGNEAAGEILVEAKVGRIALHRELVDALGRGASPGERSSGMAGVLAGVLPDRGADRLDPDPVVARAERTDLSGRSVPGAHLPTPTSRRGVWCEPGGAW